MHVVASQPPSGQAKGSSVGDLQIVKGFQILLKMVMFVWVDNEGLWWIFVQHGEVYGGIPLQDNEVFEWIFAEGPGCTPQSLPARRRSVAQQGNP